MRVPRVKGLAFRTVLALVESARGAGTVERAVAAMPEDVAHALRYGEVIAAGWYPLEWYRAMWSAIQSATGEGDAFVRQLGRDAVDEDFGGVYRVLMRMLTPKTLLSIGMRHFRHIYDTGQVRVTNPTPTSVRLRFEGCTGFDHAMWVEALGSCERLAELAGGKGAHATILSGGGNEDDACLAAVAWR